MGRKSDASGNDHRLNASLESYRAQIDKIDLQILELINKRAKCAVKIGELKNDGGSPIFAPAREEEVISNLIRHNQGPLTETTIRAVYREILSGSRALQRVLKVAFLGPEYSFSHLAMIQKFGLSADPVGVSNIAAVFEEVNRGHVDYGVVPLENSTDGRIADTLEMFIRLPQLRICSEVRLRIHHNLLSRVAQTDIRRVYSKPQALSQCRNWLSKNVPQATLHEVNSTTDAVRLAASEPGAAAVASRQAAIRYNVPILFDNIEDSLHNETRFAVIGTHDSARTGKDKTALMFQIAHSPGALADVLAIFKLNKVNVTWIESFPYQEAKGEYVFFADFEGHTEDAKVKKTLAALSRECDKLTVLGSFPVSEPVE